MKVDVYARASFVVLLNREICEPSGVVSTDISVV